MKFEEMIQSLLEPKESTPQEKLERSSLIDMAFPYAVKLEEAIGPERTAAMMAGILGLAYAIYKYGAPEDLDDIIHKDKGA